jgi:phosphatidylglycerophosphatase A
MRESSDQLNQSEVTPIPFFVKFLATGFYSGYSPIAPGTAGTIAGLAVYLIPSFENPISLGIAILVGLLFGILTGTKMENIHGHDPQVVVVDEMVGMWIALLFLPKTFFVVLGVFILFRIMDIIKPQPARLFQKKGGGVAIMMDDVIAGVYANLAMQVLVFLFGSTIS